MWLFIIHFSFPRYFEPFVDLDVFSPTQFYFYDYVSFLLIFVLHHCDCLCNTFWRPFENLGIRWVAPRSTKPFISPRSIKWVPRVSGNLVVKSKMSPIHKKRPKSLRFSISVNTAKFYFSLTKMFWKNKAFMTNTTLVFNYLTSVSLCYNYPFLCDFLSSIQRHSLLF